jgi:hypothetical protein
MDKAWKQRINNWIEEKAMFTQPTRVDQPYSPPLDTGYPTTKYRPPTYYEDPVSSPPFGEANEKYPHTPYSHTHAGPEDSPSRKSSIDGDGMTLATPSFLDPNGPNATAEDFPTKPIQKTNRFLSPIPESPNTPLADLSGENDNTLGFSSGLENRDSGGGDASGDRQRVRFRLSTGDSDQLSFVK